MKTDKNCNNWHGGTACNPVYGFGLLGALVYFFQHAPSLTDKLLAVVKAIIWPAMTIYYLLGFLQV